MKKIIITTFLFIALLSSYKVDASFPVIQSSKMNVGIGEQFYVDVLIDPEDKSINGIEGSVTFNDVNLSFVRVEEGQSFITFWIEKPTLNKNKISFAGIAPNGFSGLINPFDSSKKSEGLIMRLIFEGKRSGNASIDISPLSITLNDGEGTLVKTSAISSSINVENFENKIKYENKDATLPKLDAYVTKDESLFNGKYALVFKATDKDSGIENVMIKEGNRDWKIIESPYLLEDQSRRSIINVRATNFSGESFTLTIEPIPHKIPAPYGYIIIVIILLIIFIAMKKKYVFKK